MADTKYIGAGKPAVAGGVYIGDASGTNAATLPTSATSTISETTNKLRSLGYISEDGVRNNNSPDTDPIKEWGGATVGSISKEKADEFSFTLLEVTNTEVLKLIYGDGNVTTATNETTVEATAEDYIPHKFCIDMIIGEYAHRICIENAIVTDVAEIQYNGSNAVGYEVTISALPVNGKTHTTYIKER